MVKYGAFLSHDRGKDSQGRDNHDRVVRMSKALHARGIHVWIDDAEMSGDIDTRVCEGIDQSAIVLLFITLNFMAKVGGKGPMGEGDFCRLEFNYAKQEKTAARMLCVVMESECLKNANWSGPVKMHMGSSLFFDFTTDDNFDIKVDKLIMRMRGIAAPADWENVTGRAAGGANKVDWENVRGRAAGGAKKVESPLDGLFLDEKKDAVAKWLAIINMGEYSPGFIRCGYDSMEILVQADEKDVMEMMEDASIDMKRPHRNPFLKAWKAEKAAAEAKAAAEEKREKLRKLLEEFGLSSDDDLSKITAAHIKTVADLTFLEPEDVDDFSFSLVSRKKFVKLLEHVAKKKLQAEIEAAATSAAAAAEQNRQEEERVAKASAAAAAEQKRQEEV